MTISKKHKNHCYDGCRALCHNDSCFYNPSHYPDETDCNPIPWEVSFVWTFTKRRGCCSFMEESDRDAHFLINELIAEASQEYKKDKSNQRAARIFDLLEELKSKLDMVDD